MSEITVTITVDEAEALLPQRGSDLSMEAWNQRVDLADTAQRKIRAALREAETKPIEGQEAML